MALIGLLVTPVVLGILSLYTWPSRRNQLLGIGLVALCQWVLVATLEALPQGGFDHHGNTIWGYLLVTMGPFTFVAGAVMGFGFVASRHSRIRPAYLLAVTPLSYWAGVVFFISLAVSLELAAV